MKENQFKTRNIGIILKNIYHTDYKFTNIKYYYNSERGYFTNLNKCTYFLRVPRQVDINKCLIIIKKCQNLFIFMILIHHYTIYYYRID